MVPFDCHPVAGCTRRDTNDKDTTVARTTAFTVIKQCDRRATRGLFFSADSWLTPTRKNAEAA